jgi:dienelactone hydrolase
MHSRALSYVAAIALAVAFAASAAAAPSPAGLAGAVGVYRFADGSAAALVEEVGSLRLVDYRTGALRRLSQQARDLFVGGPGVTVPTPVSVHVTLGARRGGSVASVGIDGQTATRIPLVTRAAAFGAGGIRLAGRLILPIGKGPFPAVVIVPGSVPAHRDTYDIWALFFASRGYAVLTYDKRGVGGSTGRYVRAATDENLRNLASDALAGVRWLRDQPEIDRRRIGLSGGSQAGWVIALAASESSSVRFAAMQSGAGMSVGRQLAYSGLTRQGAVDVTEEQIHATLDRAPDSGFDPRPGLAALTIPVLWQLGTVDKRMYTPETVANLEAITADGTHAFTVRLYPGGAHSLRSTAHGMIAEERTSPGFVPGLFADLAAWLRAHA